MKFLERTEILTFEEITRLAQITVGLGVNKIRLTGGEPLIRKDISKLIKKLAQIEGLIDLSLTTNGVMLKDLAEELYLAGLRRINVSLDSLNPKKYTQLTKGDVLTKVLNGLDAAQTCGFSPIKINVVAMRGFTEEDIPDFVRFAKRKGFQVRFIEFMPLDGDDNWGEEKSSRTKRLLILSTQFSRLNLLTTPLSQRQQNSTVLKTTPAKSASSVP